MTRRKNNSLVTIETLESRQLLSSTPFGDHLVNRDAIGNQLQAVVVEAPRATGGTSAQVGNFNATRTDSAVTAASLTRSNSLGGNADVQVGSKAVAGVFSSKSIGAAGGDTNDASMLLGTLARVRAALAEHPLPDLPRQIMPVVQPVLVNIHDTPPQSQVLLDENPVIAGPPLDSPTPDPSLAPAPVPVQDPAILAPPMVVEIPGPVQDPTPVPNPTLVPAPIQAPAPDASANEPAAAGTAQWVDESGNPLFGPDGPSPDDVIQGSAADCYFLAAISAVARTDPGVIEQDVTQVGASLYQVQFQNDGIPVKELVDGLMPADSYGNLIYAQLPADNAIWAPIMEKAFAYFRSAQWGVAADYANISWGGASEVFNDLGASDVTDYGSDSIPDGATLAYDVTVDLYYNNGMAVTFQTLNQDGPLVGNHVYSVVDISQNNDGSYTLELRNPWGSTGPNNDGYNWINTNDAIGQFADLATAYV